MDSNKFPAVLQRKLILTLITGPICFVFGLAYHISVGDRMLLFISTFILVTCIGKAAFMYQTISRKKYHEVIGVCVKVSSNPISRYRKIRLLDDNLLEMELVLRKDMKIVIGYKYRFYLKSVANDSMLNITALRVDNLMGYESLGEV